MNDIELAGCHEAAAIAGVSRQRFNFLYNKGQVPEPVARLRCGTIWNAEDIRKWARERARSPGKPPEQRK